MEFLHSAVTLSFDATWSVILKVSLNTLARVCVHAHTLRQTQYIRVGIMLEWIIKKCLFLVHDSIKCGEFIQ
jgi:hypothetical protein